jgi:hypothetical protein
MPVLLAIFLAFSFQVLNFFKGTTSQKSWRDKAMESKSRLQLRIDTGFKNFLISPLIPVIFQRFHFA